MHGGAKKFSFEGMRENSFKPKDTISSLKNWRKSDD